MEQLFPKRTPSILISFIPLMVLVLLLAVTIHLFGSDAHKCHPLLSRDVADPWYTGDFAQTYADILDGCRRILEEN